MGKRKSNSTAVVSNDVVGGIHSLKFKKNVTFSPSASTSVPITFFPDPIITNIKTISTRIKVPIDVMLSPSLLSFTAQLPEKLSQNISKMMEIINRLFPTRLVPYDVVQSIVHESFVAASTEYGIHEAISWGNEFSWPTEVNTRDLHRFRSANGNLVDMVRSIRLVNGADRLNPSKADAFLSPTDADYTALMAIANGISVPMVPYEPNGLPPKLRPLYQQVHCAVNKMLYDLWSSDLVFIIPTSVALTIPEIHFSPTHWTSKRGKQCGRPIFDASDTNAGALNCPAVTEIIKLQYGPIYHPTLQDIMLLILDWEERLQRTSSTSSTTDNPIILWKADLARAFTQLNFAEDCVHLMACELTDGKTILYHSGQFGWTGMPFAFQVITRVIKKRLQLVLPGGVTMYVDDIIGICFTNDYINYIRTKVPEVCTSLLGSTAMADDKWIYGRRVEIIGWDIDLDKRIVTLSKKNFLKAFYGFFTVDLSDKRIKVKTLQCLASWASRYTTILRIMKPFSTILYQATVGMRNPEVMHEFYHPLKEAVLLWQAVLLLLKCDETNFARPFDSFRISVGQTYHIEFDASLTQVGLIIYSINSDNTRQLIGGEGIVFPFTLNGHPEYQNTCEFLAVVLGLFYLARSGIRHASLSICGDSKTALFWAHKERFKGLSVIGASLAFVLLGTKLNLQVDVGDWISGVSNATADDLSRGVTSERTKLYEEPGYGLNLAQDPAVQQLLSLCSPISRKEDDNNIDNQYFINVWDKLNLLFSDNIKNWNQEI